MCPLDLDGVNLVILELLYHYYISVSKCAMFGQFSGPCFIVRPPNFNSFFDRQNVEEKIENILRKSTQTKKKNK